MIFLILFSFVLVISKQWFRLSSTSKRYLYIYVKFFFHFLGLVSGAVARTGIPEIFIYGFPSAREQVFSLSRGGEVDTIFTEIEFSGASQEPEAAS